MFNFNTLITPLSIENIYEHEEEIYSLLVKNFQLNKVMLSPLRKENHPSFIFFRALDGKIMWHDYTGNSGDIIKFIMLYTNKTYQDAIHWIEIMFNDKLSSFKKENKVNVIEKKKERKSIICKIQPYSITDETYWKQYGISLETLKLFNVFPIRYYWMNEKFMGEYSKNNPIYGFKFSETLWKIYIPYKKIFITNVINNEVFQGESNLAEKGDLLIITKSMKDVMCLYELGYKSIAPQSETSLIKESVLNSLKYRWKDIMIWFDNDDAGKKAANKYQLKKIFIPDGMEKDVSDYYKNNNKEKTIQLCKMLLDKN